MDESRLIKRKPLYALQSSANNQEIIMNILKISLSPRAPHEADPIDIQLETPAL
jgi:hypothetical protein